VRPAQVFAVDLNEAHPSLLKLKLAGLRTLANYADFWQFFGEGRSTSNSELLWCVAKKPRLGVLGTVADRRPLTA
jgi:S-adenosylmethionine:diacylglycerol 3-amino-3-carboxypropyl transferase